MVFSWVMAFGISIFGLTKGDWMNDKAYIAGNDEILRQQNEFQAPPYCIIPTVTIGFCFQYYFLQVISTIERPNLTDE